MQNEHIFFAPSLTEVLKQLTIYRPSGVLTIWRAGNTRQEDARITIEHGRLLHIFWDSHQESANESTLGWINSWGAIHFSFFSTDPPYLQLPAPSQTAQQEQPPPPQTPIRAPLSYRSSAVTQPMYSLSTLTRPSKNPVVKAINQQGKPPGSSERKVQEPPQTQGIHRREEKGTHAGAANGETSNAIAHETVIISLTPNGKSYSLTRLPRYDRTIFMLINGRRSVVDLSQLTKRSLEEIYNTLYRLQDMRLIMIEAQAKKIP